MKINLEKPTAKSAKRGSLINSGNFFIAAFVFAAASLVGVGCNTNNNNLADRDQDGILDNIDQCPDEKGAIEYGGCASSTSKSGTADTQTPAPTEAPKAATNQQTAAAQKNSNPAVPASQSDQAKATDSRNVAVTENAMKTATPEPAVTPSEPVAKNVSARLKTNSGQNTISWNSELSKAKDLQLSITTASGLNFKKDVTGMSSYTFNPGSGEWQGKKCTVTLTSGDSKIIIDNSKLPNTFFNCSAE